VWNSKEHIQLNSSFLGDGLARFIGIVYLFYITHILPKRVILLLGLYVIIRFILLVSSFSSELLEGDYFSSFFSSDELNLKAAAFNNSFFSNADFFIINKEALKNSLDANMEMLAGSADDVSSSNEWSANDVSSSNEWSANELILKASSADNGSTLGGNGSYEEPSNLKRPRSDSSASEESSNLKRSRSDSSASEQPSRKKLKTEHNPSPGNESGDASPSENASPLGDNGSSEELSNLKRPRSDSSASEQPSRKKLKTEHNPSPGNESGDASPSENALPSVGNTSVGDASPSEIASDGGSSLENENSNANENAYDSDGSDGLGGEVMNPHRNYSVVELRNLNDRQLSDRIAGFKGMVEADEQNNYYEEMERHMEELQKLSNEKRRREQQRDEDARFLQGILDRLNEASRRR